MNKIYRWVICLMAFSFSGLTANAQYKYEREYRIKENEAPQAARTFVNSCNFTRKVCWYREQGYTNYSIEAKTTYNGRKYSIEFDTLGEIEDVEYKIKWKDIHSDTELKIKAYLDSHFTRVTVRKIQRQLLGSSSLLRQAILNRQYDKVSTNYEMVVKGKLDGRYVLREMLFDERGRFLSSSEIVFRNSDNLEF